MEEVGRCACPLPIMDVYVTTRLLPGLGDAILDGSIRPVVAIDPGDASVQAVEASGAATHVLLLPREGEGEARLCGLGTVAPTPGTARPVWADVRPGAAMETEAVAPDA